MLVGKISAEKKRHWCILEIAEQEKNKKYDGVCSAAQIAGYLATFARKEAPVCAYYKAQVQDMILRYIAEQTPSEQQHKDTLAATIATLDWKKLLHPKKGKGKGVDGTSSWLWWTLQDIELSFSMRLYTSILYSEP